MAAPEQGQSFEEYSRDTLRLISVINALELAMPKIDWIMPGHTEMGVNASLLSERGQELIVEGRGEINQRLRRLGGIAYSYTDEETQQTSEHRLLQWLGTDPDNPANFLWFTEGPPREPLSLEADLLQQMIDE